MAGVRIHVLAFGWLLVAAVSIPTAAVCANGTEMLGPPIGLSIAPGSQIIAAGVGLRDGQPGNIEISIPSGKAIAQVILYWEGIDTSATGQGPTDTILLNGTASVTGDRIGGPTLFFTSPVTGWTSTYRQDITNLALLGPGKNLLAVSGLDFGFADCGAGILVVLDDGLNTADLQIRDGSDAAFVNFAPSLDTTVPVTFDFAPAPVDRIASLENFFGSVALEGPGGQIGRPSIVRVTTSNGVTTDFVDRLMNNDGNEWDTLRVEVPVAAGVNSLTIQALSEDSGSGPFAGNLPASLIWLTSALSIVTPETTQEPGWNWTDLVISLTGSQAAYWSAFSGQPGPGGAAVSPFTILDPSNDPTSPGRPADDGTTDRVLRGFIYAWAVDYQNREVSWNHLHGNATIVNYRDGTAWEYNAWSFQDAENRPAGTLLLPPYGQLDLDGVEYAPAYDQLQLDFLASGSMAFTGGGGPFAGAVTVDTRLTLHPVPADLRQENEGVVTTKANFVIWNEDETQLTSLHRCITCWDQTLLSLYAVAGNQFLLENLQTDKGRARIDGIAGINDCGPAAQAAPLLGVAAKYLSFSGGGTFDAAGTNLVGLGTEPRVAAIRYDIPDLPPTLVNPGTAPQFEHATPAPPTAPLGIPPARTASAAARRGAC